MTEKQSQLIFEKPNGLRNKFTTFISNIPYKYIAMIGGGLGTFMYFIDVPHRRVVRRNLKFTWPEWGDDQIKKIAKRVFQNIGITLIEILQMTFFSQNDILNKARIRGEQNLYHAIKGQKGVVVVSAHLGNWEMAHLLPTFCIDTPVSLVV